MPRKSPSAAIFLIFHLIIFVGARKGEVLALCWNDFNKTLFRNKIGYVSLTSKTAAFRRVLSLNDTTLGLIEKRLTSEKERLASNHYT